MAYKILGQTSATAAAASIYGNLIKDPSFEGVSSMVTPAAYNTWFSIPGTQWYGKDESNSYYSYTKIGNPTLWTNNDATSGAGSGKYGNLSIGFASTVNTGSYDQYMGIGYGLSISGSSGAFGGSSGRFGGISRAIPITPGQIHYYGCDMAASSYSGWTMAVHTFDSSGGYYNMYSIGLNGSSSSWSRNNGSFTPSATEVYAGVEIYGYIYKNGSNMRVKIDGAYLGRDSSFASSFKDPNNPTNLLLNSGFTSRFQNTWAGEVNNSETITNYAGAPVLLYTVPASKEAVISTVTATNASPTATTYRIAVVPAAESLSQKHWVTFDSPLNAYGTDAVTIGMTLATGDKLYVAGDVTSTQFTAFGSEA